MRVMVAAPFETRGRYQGGICYVAGRVASGLEAVQDLEVARFDTCRVTRSPRSGGRVRLENFTNAVLIATGLRAELRRARPDVLYYHSSAGLALFKDLFAIAWARRRARTAVVLHIHYAELDKILPGPAPVRRFMAQRLGRVADYVVTLSSRTEAELRAAGVENVSTVYNFQETACSLEQVVHKRQRALLGADVRLLFLGSIDRRKGVLDLLRALESFERGVELDIGGSIVDAEAGLEFDRLVGTLRVPVRSHGFVSGDAKNSLLVEADVLVLPSYAEGLPVGVLEAMGAGCAVIGTTVGAMPEVVSAAGGMLVSPGDIAALEARLATAVADRDWLARAMSENFAQSARYTLDVFVAQVAAILRRVGNQVSGGGAQ